MFVKVTDRGPYVGDRGLNLSQAAAEEIGLTIAGVDEVDVRVLDHAGDHRRTFDATLGSAAVLLERSSISRSWVRR